MYCLISSAYLAGKWALALWILSWKLEFLGVMGRGCSNNSTTLAVEIFWCLERVDMLFWLPWNRLQQILVCHGESMAQFTYKMKISVWFNQFLIRLQKGPCVFYYDPLRILVVFVCQNPMMVARAGVMRNLLNSPIQTQVNCPIMLLASYQWI